MSVEAGSGGAAAAERPLAALLHARLRGSHAPVLVAGDRTLPAASLWVAARVLVGHLRELGIGPGDRVAVCTTDDLLLATTLVAGLSSGVGVALRRPGAQGATPDQLCELASAVDARLVLCAPDEHAALPVDRAAAGGVVAAGLTGLEEPRAVLPLPARHPAEPEVALLLHTSGSTGAPTWVALSQANVEAVLSSHLTAFFGRVPQERDDRPAGVMASVLPWSHAFGAVLDLLVGLVAAEIVLREPPACGDPVELADLLHRAGAGAWLNAVPLTLRRLLDLAPSTLPDDDAPRARSARDLLAGLGGGLVGGAACDPELAAALSGTRLRVGYGMTEASPGVCLGEPGEFGTGLIGRPVGCALSIVEHELQVTGPNVSLGTLDAEGALVRRESSTLSTGDTVRDEGGRYVFTGRMRDTVKLGNGRWLALADVDAAVLAGTGVACTAVLRAGLDLELVVDADAETPAGADTETRAGADPSRADRAEQVGRWLREISVGASGLPDAARRPAWVGHVAGVRAVPQALWPRSPKGEVLRAVLAAGGAR